MLPAAFKKSLTQASNERFVIKKDIYAKCLVLYPLDEWEQQLQMIRERINPYDREHSQFLREFFKGSAEITLDNTNRLLIPKRLLDEAEIEKEVVLAGQFGKIELWSKKLYDQSGISADEYASLANNILGNQNKGEKDAS